MLFFFFFLTFLTQKLAPLRVLNAIIFYIDEQCNLIFETALFTNCKIYIIFLFKWVPLSFLSHFCFFIVSPFLCSLSLSLSLSKHMVDSQWPSKSQTHGWFVTNPKLATDHHRGSPRQANRGGPWRATAPWPLTRSKPTHSHTRYLNPPMAIHGDLNPPTATHSDLNPTHSEPWPPPPHENPIAIWSLQVDLEREEKLSLWEEERRKRDGFARGGDGEGCFFFFFFFFCYGWWWWVDLVVVGGCGGFFLLWFFFSFFVSGGCGMGGW